MIDSHRPIPDTQNASISKIDRTVGVRLVLIGMGVLLLLVGLYFAVKPLTARMLPVRYVRIYGALERVQKNQIRTALEALVDQGYWGADLSAIQNATESLPWVARVQIHRIWPDTLMLGVVEQVPYVRWGKSALLNTNGDRFAPDSIAGFKNLPVIFGPDGKEVELVKVFRNLQNQLADQQLGIETLSVSDRFSWSVRLLSGLDIAMGRRNPIQAFTRFIETLPLLGPEQVNAMRRIDLRYPNGYSVDWKPGIELEWRPVTKQSVQGTNQRVWST